MTPEKQNDGNIRTDVTCDECGEGVLFKELYHPYNNGRITACISCWREALAAGGWPGDTNERRDGEED